MWEQCAAFHRLHPEVWSLFEKYTFDRIRRGFKHYSSDAIFHRIRWEMALPSYEKGKEFKLNDHHTAFYARRFMRLHVEHDGFFHTRTQKSKTKTATNLPPIRPDLLI